MFYFNDGILNIKKFIKISTLISDKIIFIFKDYKLLIEGNELKISSYYEEEAFVTGKIERINILHDWF